MKNTLFAAFFFVSAHLASGQTYPKGGINFYMQPWFRIEEKPGGYGQTPFHITLDAINQSPVTDIEYNGRTFNYNDFGGQLRSYFDAVKINALNVYFDLPCFGKVASMAYNLPAGGVYKDYFQKKDKSCKLSIGSYEIRDFSVAGIDELKQKIRLLVDQEQKEAADQKQKQDQLNDKQQNQTAIPATGGMTTPNPNLNAPSDPTLAPSPPVNKAEVNNLINQAIAAYNSGDSKTAADLLNRAEQLDPNNPVIAQNKAVLAKDAQQTQQIMNDIQKSADDSKQQFQQNAQQLAQQLGTGLYNGADKLDQAEKKLDPTNKFNWKFVGLTYEFMPGTSDAYSQYCVDLQASFLAIAFGLRFGNTRNELQEFAITRKALLTSSTIPEKIVLGSEGINMELSLGFNIPIKNFSIRPMYGLGLLNGGEVFFKDNDDFRLTDQLPANLESKSINRFFLGVYYQIPKTTIGLGINISYLSQEAYSIKSDQVSLTYTGNRADYKNGSTFLIGKPKSESFDGLSTAFSFIFGLPVRR